MDEGNAPAVQTDSWLFIDELNASCRQRIQRLSQIIDQIGHVVETWSARGKVAPEARIMIKWRKDLDPALTTPDRHDIDVLVLYTLDRTGFVSEGCVLLHGSLEIVSNDPYVMDRAKGTIERRLGIPHHVVRSSRDQTLKYAFKIPLTTGPA